MRSRISSLLVCIAIVAFSTCWLMAQDQSGEKSKSDTRTITGCLTKGDSANEYMLTSEDGSTWEVRSDSVSLAEHVGHEITATGAVKNAMAHNMKEDTKDAASDMHMKKNNTEHGHMTVTNVKMVSHTCK